MSNFKRLPLMVRLCEPGFFLVVVASFSLSSWRSSGVVGVSAAGLPPSSMVGNGVVSFGVPPSEGAFMTGV